MNIAKIITTLIFKIELEACLFFFLYSKTLYLNGLKSVLLCLQIKLKALYHNFLWIPATRSLIIKIFSYYLIQIR